MRRCEKNAVDVEDRGGQQSEEDSIPGLACAVRPPLQNRRMTINRRRKTAPPRDAVAIDRDATLRRRFESMPGTERNWDRFSQPTRKSSSDLRPRLPLARAIIFVIRASMTVTTSERSMMRLLARTIKARPPVGDRIGNYLRAPPRGSRSPSREARDAQDPEDNSTRSKRASASAISPSIASTIFSTSR